jgi:UDP-N-acetylmuramate dehydrogenase
MKTDENKSLRPYHTFHLDIRAKYFTEAKSVDELKEIINSEIFKSNSHLILGGGSNILFTKDFDGLVIKISIGDISVLNENEETVSLKVGAGVVWNDFVSFCVNNGLYEVANLALIPGTVGAAPMQNIGAYGVELQQVFLELEALDKQSGLLRVFKKVQCNFGYRESVFKNIYKDKYIITSVSFGLYKDQKLNDSYSALKERLIEAGIGTPTGEDIHKAVIHIRQSKLPNPDEIGNAGSFFKNPTISGETYERLRNEYSDMPGYPQEGGAMKVPAGWLIEKDGWKGKTIGNIGVHKNQALVLVNYGGGSGKEIWALAQQIQASIKQRFGIELSAEVNIV